MDVQKNRPEKPVAPLRQLRRRAQRVELIESCPFEMSEDIGGGMIILHEGEALSINVSSGGLLLLMDQAPQVGQVLKVQVPTQIRSTNSLTLVEVRWTRQVLAETPSIRYLVGVRSLFGPQFYE